MFKFIRKKILEGIVKDIIAEMPKVKELALDLFKKHKDELLEKVKDAIMAEIKKMLKAKID